MKNDGKSSKCESHFIIIALDFSIQLIIKLEANSADFTQSEKSCF